MNRRRRRWLACLLGSGLLALLLSLVSLDDRYRVVPPEALALRPVEVYEPPPPPPPPSVRRDSSRGGERLTLANPNRRIALEVMELDVDLPAGQLGSFGLGFPGTGEGLGGGIDIVSLSDLDEIPMVVRAPALVYPDEAIARGIDEFRVLVHVLIDEEGRSYPAGIVQNPVRSYDRALMDYASEVRFSPPLRLGIPVKTEYLWPLLIKRPPAD